jgi:predicted TIM-barrel fold metal-dependent hydrolase
VRPAALRADDESVHVAVGCPDVEVVFDHGAAPAVQIVAGHPDALQATMAN